MLHLSALAMLIFGSIILYGGLIYFLYKAIKRQKKSADRQKINQ
jgi:hypothetical protein